MSETNSNQQYVIAVSGGIDSMVLLDMLIHNRCPDLKLNRSQIIVAHFDHGIRTDSLTDEKFVRGVVGDYELSYETERVELGPDASEEKARQARYKFLRQCCKKHNAKLVTAHHQDDVIETMIINLIRGTGWRGLAPMSQIIDLRSQILECSYSVKNEQAVQIIIRPLLSTPKAQLLDYAKKYNVAWREDSTNIDQTYLRNYVRGVLLPQAQLKDPDFKSKLLKINKNTIELKNIIATELQNLSIKYQLSNIAPTLPRYECIMWPPTVAYEVIYTILTQLDPDWHPSTLQLKRTLHFIKVGSSGKRLEVSKRLYIDLKKTAVQFKKA